MRRDRKRKTIYKVYFAKIADYFYDQEEKYVEKVRHYRQKSSDRLQGQPRQQQNKTRV
ncbi:MAG: DUF3907 family protein [Helicobacteraceae bacterium]|nr:DUF3907 family protein [Helicobacteraceae bacterium]